MPFQHLRHLDDLPEEQRKFVKLGFEPDEPCQAQAGVAIRDTEGQAGDAVCRDGKARFLQPEAAMVRIEAKGVAGTTCVGKAYESLTAQIEFQSGIVEGPIRRHCYLAVAERRHALKRWPGFTARNRRTVERPAIQRNRTAHSPQGEFFEFASPGV